MNIVLASAEVFPFAKAGGLADVSGYLPKEWEALGHRSLIVMPKYGDIDVEKFKLKPMNLTIAVPMGSWTEFGQVWSATLPDSTVPVYFIESADYFDRKGIYGNPDGFTDNNRRFVFLSRAVFELAAALNFKPDVILANDYHTAFTMPFLKIHYRDHQLFRDTVGVQSIHNMAFHGVFEPQETLYLAQIGMDQFYSMSWFEFHGALNTLKAGIMFADKITTVSPTYALEIRYSDQGHGLQNVLLERAGDLIGILNGVDYNVWDPETDKSIYVNYTTDSVEKKWENKYEFLRRSNVHESEVYADMPLIGMVSRLTDQKGFDVVRDAIEYLLHIYPIRFTLLGSGGREYESYFRDLNLRMHPRTLIQIGYDEQLSHRIEAASDIFLMPSRFEPCGLNQMYSLKYGTIPIVRRTGGLADTVHEFDAESGTGNGFLFDDLSVQSLVDVIGRALNVYYNKAAWKMAMRNAMTADNSARKSAKAYLEVFEWARRGR